MLELPNFGHMITSVIGKGAPPSCIREQPFQKFCSCGFGIGKQDTFYLPFFFRRLFSGFVQMNVGMFKLFDLQWVK